jgi:uncharacterized membrane protein YkvA (DUF1232 family)
MFVFKGINRTSENPQKTNFRELWKGEVRRIPIPRTRVNRTLRPGLGASIVYGWWMNLETWMRWARRLSAQTYALYLAYRHPRTPWYAKVFAALIVGYVFSPIDPIPDFIPVVGLLDEMVVVPIGVLLAAKMIPPEVFEECREKAREVAEGEKPVSRVAAVVIVAVWVLCVALAVYLALRVF